MDEREQHPPLEFAELAQPPTEAETPPPGRPCPVCGQPMVTERRSGVAVEICHDHGVWLAGEALSAMLTRSGRRGGTVWKSAAVGLCVLQILGISGSVLAAAWDIESICGTGPTFSLVGVLVAFGYRISRSLSSVVFGLSAAVVSAACFVWIFTLSWSPGDAQHPVSSALIGYEMLILPVGWFALYRTLRPRAAKSAGDDRPWQFGIGSLLALTAVLAVMMGFARLVYLASNDVRLAVAAGLLALAVTGISIVVFVSIKQIDDAAAASQSRRPGQA